MKKWLVQLYPYTWRQRYEAEFVALLEQERLTFWLVLDIAYGIVDAYWLLAHHKMEELMNIIRLQPWRIALILLIGLLLVIRSVLHTSLLMWGFDIVGLAGFSLLMFGLALAYTERRTSMI